MLEKFRIWPYAMKYFFFFLKMFSIYFFEIIRRKQGILILDLYFTV